MWGRVDWGRPVGYFSNLRVNVMRSVVRDMVFTWQAIRIDQLRLGHKAALLLLQGRSLSEILIPNHSVYVAGQDVIHRRFAHVLLRVDPWQYWSSAPALTGLVLARLGDLPAGLGSGEVLGELIQRTAA